MVAEHIGLDLLGVATIQSVVPQNDRALVADLAAALGIERRAVQHHHAALPGGELMHRTPSSVQRHD
jgi:hypothetical protein